MFSMNSALHRAASTLYGVLCPVYVRGLADLMLHRGIDAARESRKILDHPGMVANDLIGALAHLQLGRSLRAVGRCGWSTSCLQRLPCFVEMLPTRIFRSCNRLGLKSLGLKAGNTESVVFLLASRNTPQYDLPNEERHGNQ